MKRVAVLLAAVLLLGGIPFAFAAETLHFVIMAPSDPKKGSRSTRR